MYGVRQSDTYITNDKLYRKLNQRPVSFWIRKRQLNFDGHCLHMPPEEPANIYALYQSKVRDCNKIGRPTTRYIEQISEYLTRDTKIKINNN